MCEKRKILFDDDKNWELMLNQIQTYWIMHLI